MLHLYLMFLQIFKLFVKKKKIRRNPFLSFIDLREEFYN